MNHVVISNPLVTMETHGQAAGSTSYAQQICSANRGRWSRKVKVECLDRCLENVIGKVERRNHFLLLPPIMHCSPPPTPTPPPRRPAPPPSLLGDPLVPPSLLEDPLVPPSLLEDPLVPRLGPYLQTNWSTRLVQRRHLT